MNTQDLSERAKSLAQDNIERATNVTRETSRRTIQWSQQALERVREFLFRRHTAYNKIFQGPYAGTVLADLAVFCRARETTWHTDPRAAAVMEGRREVWLRIQEHLQLTEKQLWELRNPEKLGLSIDQEEDHYD